MLSLPQYDHRGSLDFRRDAYERSYVVLALLSEIGRVETRNLTRRGETADAAQLQGEQCDVPVALGIWVYSAVARCFAWTRVAP